MALTISVTEIVEKNLNPLLGKQDSWSRIPLGEIAEVLNGFAFKSSQFNNKHGMPLIRIRDVGKNTIDTKYSGEYDATYVVKNGDLLVGMDGDFNCARWHGPDALLNQRVCKITLKTDKYLSRFLDYVLPGYLQAINEFTSSVTVKHLSSNTIKEIPLPFPLIEIQLEIVAYLDKQTSRLDESVNALMRIQANLKRYKAAVLKFAVEGVEKKWWRPIEQAIESIGQGWSPQCEREASHDFETWGVIKTTAVQAGAFLEDKNKKLPEKLQPRPDLEIQQNDILITRAGPKGRVGVACLVRSSRPRLMICDKVYRLRCMEKVMRPDFLELVLNAPIIVDALDELKTGISDSGVNLTQVRFNKLLIPLPPIPVQKAIIEEVERQLSVNIELEATIQTNLKRAERLRQRILSSSFRGY